MTRVRDLISIQTKAHQCILIIAMMVTGDTDQDNCDDDGDHIGVDDDDKDEKEVAVHNKGTLLPFL